MEDNPQLRNQCFFFIFFQDGHALFEYKKEGNHSIRKWGLFQKWQFSIKSLVLWTPGSVLL